MRINIHKLLQFSSNLTAATIRVTHFFLAMSIALLFEPLIEDRSL